MMRVSINTKKLLSHLVDNYAIFASSSKLGKNTINVHTIYSVTLGSPVMVRCAVQYCQPNFPKCIFHSMKVEEFTEKKVGSQYAENSPGRLLLQFPGILGKNISHKTIQHFFNHSAHMVKKHTVHKKNFFQYQLDIRSVFVNQIHTRGEREHESCGCGRTNVYTEAPFS